MTNQDADSNGRVTLAILRNDIQHIIALLEDEKKNSSDREARLRDLERVRFPGLDTRITRIEERQSTLAKLQVVYSTVAAALAGFFGSR